ncbi:dephospho-CoA kinase [Candidatus Pelagibacter sp.]|nr:dephospho-CoA kinase [Candidatus Pelagibacter sp.]
MIRVCVLGTIGSGKSFVSKLFNCPVFNADRVVNYIYRKDENCFKKLRKKFPDHIKSFPVRKSELISAILSKKINIKKISKIVHPIVRKNLKNFLKEKKNSKMVVLDIPLLIENKLNKKGDVLIFVKTKRSKIIKRLKRRKNYNKKILDKLRSNQSSLLKKERLSNYVIDNNNSINIIKNKIKKLKKEILNEGSNS